MYDTLIEEAKQAREKAYTPYSHFKVGVAAQTTTGKIFQGCNIENSSYGATVCAERNALFHAYTHDERDIEALAIVADISGLCPPCGICRQVISELGGNIDIVLANLKGDVRILKANDLFPEAFSEEFL